MTQGPGPPPGGPDCGGEREQALAASVNARKLQVSRKRNCYPRNDQWL
jgi:hypothetical protein